jgi:hypothetical protein
LLIAWSITFHDGFRRVLPGLLLQSPQQRRPGGGSRKYLDRNKPQRLSGPDNQTQDGNSGRGALTAAKPLFNNRRQDADSNPNRGKN